MGGLPTLGRALMGADLVIQEEQMVHKGSNGGERQADWNGGSKGAVSRTLSTTVHVTA